MGRAPFRSSGNRSQAKMLTKQPTSAELASLTMMQVCGKGGSLSLAYSVKLVSDQVIFQQIIRNSCRNSRILSNETRWFCKCFGILTTAFKNTAAICSSDKILTGEVDYNSNKESAMYLFLSNLSTVLPTDLDPCSAYWMEIKTTTYCPNSFSWGLLVYYTVYGKDPKVRTFSTVKKRPKAAHCPKALYL